MSRRLQVLTEGQFWRDTAREDVRAGMVFRVFESDGREVADEDGHVRWRAVADALLNDDGETYRIEAEAIPLSAAEVAAISGVGFFPLHQSRLGSGWRGLR